MKNTIKFAKVALCFTYLVTPSFFLCMWLAEKWPEIFSNGPVMALITVICACFQAVVAADVIDWLRERKA